MNVVAIVAHGDDEMRCLGTMLKCKARGDKLFLVTVTDGAGGFVQKPTISRKEATIIRDRELAAVADAIGAECFSLHEEDEFLYDTKETRHKVLEAIRKTKADLIFTHYFEDYNVDHTTVHTLVKQCVMHSWLPMQATASPPLKQNPAVFLIEPHTPAPFPASYFVDITDFFDKKVAALNHHVSQTEAMGTALRTDFRDLCGIPDAYFGQKVGCKYAEAFVPLRGRLMIKPYNVLP